MEFQVNIVPSTQLFAFFINKSVTVKNEQVEMNGTGYCKKEVFYRHGKQLCYIDQKYKYKSKGRSLLGHTRHH